MADRQTPEQRPGKLKIFFGYAAGVGRTRAMLDAAAERLGQGWRVLRMHDAGAAAHDAEAAGPPGLVCLPIPATRDLDVDAVRRRAPDLVLVPDLERTNTAAARHRRRAQDVRELLEAGVDVWSTLEVRHVESLAELVERVTGQEVPDTVPDAVLDAADDLELIDLPPEELLERMRRAAAAGPAAATARAELPDRTVLVALREVAMRYAADRLHRLARQRSDGQPAPPLGERLLVGVGPSPTSARVIRAASRMAQSMRVPWFAVHIAPAAANVDIESAVGTHLQLARSLGAEVAIVPGSDIAAATAAFARGHGVTRILVGETRHAGWRSWLQPSLVHRVIAASTGIEVLVILGTEAPTRSDDVRTAQRSAGPRGYGGACLVLLVATALAWAFDAAGLGEADKVLVYLLAVTAAAAWLGRGPSVFASFGAVLSFNFFFTAPRFTLQVQDPDYLFTFAVMLVIGLLVSTLTSRIRDQSIVARQRERRSEQLYGLSHDLSATTGHLQIVHAAEAHLRAFTNRDVAIILPQAGGELHPASRGSTWLSQEPRPMATADWVFAHGRMAGAGTDTHASERTLFLPLRAHDETLGVLAIRAPDPALLLLADNRRMVETFAAQVTMALQRDRLTEQVHHTLAQAENERLRSALLSSVSHDLRTPLATITGVTSSLLDAEQGFDATERAGLLRTVHGEAERLARLLDNLFHMTRLESGEFAPQRDWNVVEDVVGSALTRLVRQLGPREVTTDIAEGMPLLRVDGVLIELVLTNLLDNAIRYSAPDTTIGVSARTAGQQVELAVADRGPGLSDEEKRRAFEKFYRGPSQRGDRTRGSGLGLSICAAIAQLHGGSIRIEDREGGGARFVLSLPIEAQPPALGEPPTVDVDAGEPA